MQAFINELSNEKRLSVRTVKGVMLTGIRVGEWLAMVLGQVDFENNTITIDRAITKVCEYDENRNLTRRRTDVGDTKTYCSERRFKVSPVVTDVLREWREALPGHMRSSVKSVLTADELRNITAALKGIGSISKQSQIERILDKLHAGTDAVASLSEPIIIDLASYYKGQLTTKIEMIKKAVLERRLIEFDYFYDKGESHRRIEPYFVIFQWTAWYVFGFCTERQDWRLFKLLRLWNLSVCDETYTPREIPPEKREFNAHITEEIELVALFEPSEKYKLIETYGLDCFTETPDGILFECSFSSREYLISWLLGFGNKVKVLEPADIAEGVKAAAENILSRYK